MAAVVLVVVASASTRPGSTAGSEAASTDSATVAGAASTPASVSASYVTQLAASIASTNSAVACLVALSGGFIDSSPGCKQRLPYRLGFVGHIHSAHRADVAHFAPLRRLRGAQSIRQFSSSVRPPSAQGSMWSPCISSMPNCSPQRLQRPRWRRRRGQVCGCGGGGLHGSHRAASSALLDSCGTDCPLTTRSAARSSGRSTATSCAGWLLAHAAQQWTRTTPPSPPTRQRSRQRSPGRCHC